MWFTRRRRGVGIDPSELLGIFLDLGLMCFHNVAYTGQELAFVRAMSTVADDTGLDLLRLSVVSLKGTALPCLGDQLQLRWIPWLFLCFLSLKRLVL